MNLLKTYSGNYNLRSNMTENINQKHTKMFPCQQIATLYVEINNSVVSKLPFTMLFHLSYIIKYKGL